MNKKILLVIGGVLLLSNIGSSTYASVSKINDKVGAIKYITTATVQDNYFIIPYSSTSYLTIADLQGLTLDQLEIARNEIYARHGYQFQQQKMIDYFSNQSWYTRSQYKITTDDLSELEYANVMLIQQQENSLSSGLGGDYTYYCGNFVIPDSSYRKITADELKYLSTFELAIARNEIYARHGYIFVSNEWKDFFVNEYWYTPTAYSVTLNSIEEYNVGMILNEEAIR